MPHALDDATATALVQLFPWVLQRPGGDPVATAAQRLLDEERARRGAPDATGALNPLALQQGTLLKEEFDLSLHAHGGWTVGGVVVDVQRLIHVNAQHGFKTGDALLAAVVRALAALFPGAKVVRLHGGTFAAVLGPISGLRVDAGTAERTRTALGAAATAVLPPGATVPGFTVATLELTIEEPSHWQVLGPLVWAELERAFTVEKQGAAQGVQVRRLQLGGFVPQAHGR